VARAAGGWVRHAGALPVVAALALAPLGGCRSVPPRPLSADVAADAFLARSLDDPGLRSFMEASLGRPFAVWPPDPWDLDALTLAALFYQPGLAVARAQRDAARAAIGTAGRMPNPTVSVQPQWSPGTSPWLAIVQLDWPIETAGKRGHRLDQARADASASQQMLVTAAWQTRRAVRDALIEWVAAGARAAALEDLTLATHAWRERMETRLRLGAASRAELVAPAQGEIQARAQLADARRLRALAAARLASVIGVPAHAIESLRVDFPLGRPDDPFALRGETELQRSALLERADVLEALDRYAASEAALRLELARRYPDLHLNPGYEFDQGQHKWAIGVTLELPLLDQNQGPIAQAEAARSEAAARFVAVQAGVLSDFEQAAAAWRGASQALQDAAALVEALRAERERVDSAVSLGAADATAALLAEIDWRRSELARLEAARTLDLDRSAFEAAVQGPIESAAIEGGAPLAGAP
jgi:outer membrane protein, heavy metal efflux system